MRAFATRRRHLGNRSRPAALIAALTIAVAGLGATPTGSAPVIASGTYDVMSSAEKQGVLWDIMEDFVPRIEDTWVTPSDIPQTDGYYETDAPGIWQSRGEANIAAIYATLLTNSSQSSYGGIPRGQMEDRLTETIKHIAYQNNHAPGTQTKLWGAGAVVGGNGNAYVNPSTAEPFGWAAQLWWNELEEEDQDVVETVIVAEANDILNDTYDPWPLGTLVGNTKLEDDAVAASLLSIAVAMFDSNPNAGAWGEDAKVMAMNAWGRAADESDNTLVDGVPVADWIEVVNVFDDYTAHNHSVFHPTYLLSNPAPLVYYAHRGFSIPEAFQFRMAEEWDNVLGPLMSDDGDIIMPTGTDWIYHDFQHVAHLAAIGTILGRNDAAVYESRAIQALRARQNAHPSGSLYGMTAVGYEADVVRVMSLAWSVHEFFGPAPEPTEAEFDAARSAYDGVYHFPSQLLMFARNDNAFNSMTWEWGGFGEPTGLVIPSSDSYLDDPTLMLSKTASSLGSGTGSNPAYFCDCSNPSDFSTAAIVASGTRKFSYSAFPDGSAILLDRGTGATFTYSFERTPGLTGARPVYDETGQVTGTASLFGTWANVADRFGIVAVGGAGLGVTEVAEDIDAKVNSHTVVTGATGTGNGNRAALILPLASRQQTAAAAPFLDSSTISDSNWSAATGRGTDGTARIAVARWGGAASATVTMISPIGVPIPDRPNDVTVTSGGTGTTSFSLPSPGSAGHRGYFWVSSTNTVTVRPITETRVRLTNGASGSTVTVRYVDADGVLHAAVATLAANAVAYAHAVDDGVAIVTPSASSTSGSFTPALAYDGNTTSSNNWWSSSAGAPQDLILDFGKKVDIGGVTMTPVSSNGPRNYTVDVSTSATGCSTWSTPGGGTVTNASSSGATVTSFTTAQRAQCVRIHTTTSWGSLVKVRELSINPPTIDIDPVNPLHTSIGGPSLNVARSGWNTATIRIRNRGASATNVTVGGASLPSGVTANAPSTSVPAGGFADVQLNFTASGSAPTSGTTAITLTGTGAANDGLNLVHGTNQALNAFGTAFPAALGSSVNPSYRYPASLATNGNTASSLDYWVSAKTLTASTPECLVVDLGTTMTVGRAVMTPRAGSGPKDYKVQTSTSGGTDCQSTTGWTDRATITNSGDGTVKTSTWTPVSARYVRIRVTASYSSGSPFEVAVRELVVNPS